MPKMTGESFTKPTDDTPAPLDVKGFDPRAWARGTALVTRSVPVCGRPDLMGHIEALKDELERVQAAEFDDDRPMVKSRAQAIATELEQARRDMLDSMATFTFRGLRPGEYEAMKAEHGPVDAKGITDLDYKVWARQCIRITPAVGEPVKGIDWETLKLMHLGDRTSDDPEEWVEGLGPHFLRTIAVTANAASDGGGVDVPFSSASSALTQPSSKS